MIKKFVALAVTALFSCSANAGYVQYDFDLGAGGHGLRGYIVQHDTDQSIALFDFYLQDPVDEYRFGAYFYPRDDEGYIRLDRATTYFRKNGPTNFHISDSFGADHFTQLDVTFARAKGEKFEYTASYTADLFENHPPEFFSGTLTGLATRGVVDPIVANYLDSIGGYEYALPRIVPTYIGPREVPEPASLALFALGAAGLARAARRRSSPN